MARFFVRIVHSEGRVSRRNDQPFWTDPYNGYLRQQFFAIADHPIELTEIELSAGARLELPASSYALMAQAVWVWTGSLQIIEGGERQNLLAGDCLAFGPPSDTDLANIGHEKYHYLVITLRR